MVDDKGNLMGIIDLIQTLPRCVGYSRYPGWITRDWDPLMSEELERYRIYYCQAIGKLCSGAGTGSWSSLENLTSGKQYGSLR
jgi:hypothetical protein